MPRPCRGDKPYDFGTGITVGVYNSGQEFSFLDLGFSANFLALTPTSEDLISEVLEDNKPTLQWNSTTDENLPD